MKKYTWLRNILSHQGNANYSYFGISPYPSHNGQHQENKRQQTLLRTSEKGNTTHYWWECKLDGPNGNQSEVSSKSEKQNYLVTQLCHSRAYAQRTLSTIETIVHPSPLQLYSQSLGNGISQLPADKQRRGICTQQNFIPLKNEICKHMDGVK